MIRRSAAAALATLAVFSVTTSWGAEQTAQKKPAAKVGSTEAQKSTASGSKRLLVLSGSVPLEGVKGRFDHFAFGQGRVFVSALGNNTVEVINVFGGTVEHTITGVSNPQGVAFSPETHKLFVASAKGKVLHLRRRILRPY
jgi:YVTN family beta-propeller protein